MLTGDEDLEDAVLGERRFELTGIHGERERHGPGEFPPITFLQVVLARGDIIVIGAIPANREDVLEYLDVDVLHLHPGERRLDHDIPR